jgi:hypothetical protein
LECLPQVTFAELDKIAQPRLLEIRMSGFHLLELILRSDNHPILDLIVAHSIRLIEG